MIAYSVFNTRVLITIYKSLCLQMRFGILLNVSAMKILLSEGAMTALTRLGGYDIESRGHIDVKVRNFVHTLSGFKKRS